MHLQPHDCDLLAADLLPSEKAAELGAHAASCPGCSARIEAARADRAAFLAANPPLARAHGLLEEVGRGPAPSTSRWRWLWATSGLAALASALLVVVARGGGSSQVRLKGESLSCRLIHEGREAALLTPGDEPSAAAGDALRCFASPGLDGSRHLEVWGAQAGARAQRLFAGDLDGPSEVPPGSAFAIHGEGKMRLYFVWSNAALAEERLATRFATLSERPSIEGARIEWIGVLAR